MRIWRRAAALGAATAIAMASASFAMPGVAAAETLITNCGGSVTGKVGDTVKANTSVLGLNLGAINLGPIQEGATVLSKTVGLVQKLLCRVTVTVDKVAAGVDKAAPEPLKKVTKPVSQAVTGTTEGVRKAAGAQPAAAPPATSRPAEPPGAKAPAAAKPAAASTGRKAQKPKSPNAPLANGSSAPAAAFPYSNPLSFFGGDTSLFDARAGLPYGESFPQAPQFGLLGEAGLGVGSGADIRNAGSARAIGSAEGGVGLPMVLAVLALAGASAGLVRAWVLRSATTAG